MGELEALLAGVPGYSSLTVAMKTAALQGARIPDSEGRYPGEEDYVDTYDVYFAALNLLGYLQAQPFISQVSSEGTSTTVQPPDWSALTRYYQSQSPIMRLQGDTLQVVQLPYDDYIRRTDMSGRSGRFGDVDTDLG